MAEKFGDGRLYKFEESRSVYNKFTHKGMDDWSYHESWFVDDAPMFSDEDFLL